MKELGVPNRCRVFQIPGNIEYIKALSRMRLYMEYSANIYAICGAKRVSGNAREK